MWIVKILFGMVSFIIGSGLQFLKIVFWFIFRGNRIIRTGIRGIQSGIKIVTTCLWLVNIGLKVVNARVS